MQLLQFPQSVTRSKTTTDIDTKSRYYTVLISFVPLHMDAHAPASSSELFISSQCPVAITGYQIRDPELKAVYFSRGQSFGQQIGECAAIPGVPAELGILYTLPRAFLRAKFIASQVIFANITDSPLQDLTLIETHFLAGKELQQFKFELMFVPPRTQNTWEHIYQPEFKRDRKFDADAIKGPWDVETKMYVAGTLVMFTRAQLRFE